MADPIFSDPRLGSGIEGPGYIVRTTAEARYKRSLYVSLVVRLATGSEDEFHDQRGALRALLGRLPGRPLSRMKTKCHSMKSSAYSRPSMR